MNACLAHKRGLLSPILLLLLLASASLACEPTDALRFTRSERVFRFDNLGFDLEVQGAFFANSGEIEAQTEYDCPVYVVDRESGARIPTYETVRDVTVIRLDATSPTPGITVTLSDPLIGADGVCPSTNRPIALEIEGLPLDALQTQSCERIDGELVCSTRAGRFRLVAYSELVDNAGSDCARELSQDTSTFQFESRCSVCNALEAREVLSELRTVVPNENRCCETSAKPVHVVCLNPCPCRRTRYELELIPETEDPPPLKLAVVSEVEDDVGRFQTFLAAARAADVDAVINIGDLTSGGSDGASRLVAMSTLAQNGLVEVDTGTDCRETDPDALACCRRDRVNPRICNAVTDAIPFMSGLGENEISEEVFETFFDTFGPSNFNIHIGGVQLIMLDSADAKLSTTQFAWLEEQLAIPEPLRDVCEYPRRDPVSGPTHLGRDCAGNESCNGCMGSQGWVCVPPDISNNLPSFGDRNCLCTFLPRLNADCTGSSDCDDCLGLTGVGVCAVPEASRSGLETPSNCICVTADSTICPNNFACVTDRLADGSAAQPHCACTRDEDCGPGFRCLDDGSCEPPLRLVFTHTPPFDLFGARNSAFRSRREAARLVATLLEGEVDYIFAGSLNTFRDVLTAGIRTFITGGGGQDLEIFDETGHHWLLVTIPNAFDAPDPASVTVEVQKLP